MIGSWRGALIALAIAACLAALALVDRRRADDGVAAAPDRALVPGLAIDDVAALRWEPGGSLARGADGAWRADGEPAERETVDAALAALRAGRWHREAPAATAGAPTVRLAVLDRAGTARATLAIGGELAGTGQRWLVRGDRALLVDAWIARALAPPAWALPATRPLADVATAPRIAIALDGAPPIDLVGQPRRRQAWLDPDAVATFEAAAAALAVIGAPAGNEGARAVAITIGDVEVSGSGAACADETTATIAIARGPHRRLACVARPAWDALAAAARVLAGPIDRAIDRRPLPFAARAIHLADGDVVLGKPPTVVRGGVAGPTDPTAVAELLAALATPAELVAVEAPRDLAPAIAIDGDGASIHLALVADGVTRREDGAHLRLGPGARAIVARGAAAYASRTPWAEEPTTIARVTIDGATSTRGAVIGEWTGPHAAAALEAYVAALARPIAVAIDPDPAPPRGHAITFEVAAPGRSATHTLVVGQVGAAGCRARADGAALVLPRALCVPPSAR